MSQTPYRARIEYIQPGYSEIKRRFPGQLDSNFSHLRFQPSRECQGLATETREIEFELIHLSTSVVGSLFTLSRQGMRHAMYEELLGFVETYPAEQLKYPILARGSYTIVVGEQYVPYAYCDDTGRTLGLRWSGVHKSTDRLLAVRLAD